MNRLDSSLLIFGAAGLATLLVLFVHRILLPRFGIRIGTGLGDEPLREIKVGGMASTLISNSGNKGVIMILIISAQQPQYDGPVERRFGRAPWLIKVNTETGAWEAFQNPGEGKSGGAGVSAAQFVIDQKADAAASGDFGPNAAAALRAADVEMYLFTNDALTVKEAAERFGQGDLAVF